MPGLGSAHLLQGPQAAAMTNEQRIRGADRRVDSAVILTGYDAAAVAEGAKQLIGDGGVEGRGARELRFAIYRCSYSLARAEVDAWPQR